MARVLLLIASNQRRGAEVFASDLANALASLGHSPTLLAVSPSTVGELLDVEVAGRSRWDLRGLRRIRQAAVAHDVVVGNGSTTLIAGSVAAMATRRPFIYRNIGDPAAWGDIGFADQRIGMPLRSAAGVAALYERGRDELINRYRLDPDRVRVIPNGVQAHAFPPRVATRTAAARDTLGLSPDLHWLGCVGALNVEKNLAAAIEAVGRDSRLGLVIAGDGPQRSELEALARKVAPNRVKFLGALSDVRTVLEAIEVLVIPSLTEGIPAVAIEASLSGVPVVASDVGGMSEVVIGGSTGYLVPPGDADQLLEAVGKAMDRGDAMGEAARAHCLEHFTMERLALQWSDLIDHVVSLHVSRRGDGPPTRGT